MKKLPSVFVALLVLAAFLLGACEQPPGSNAAREAAEAFARAHAAALAKAAADIAAADGAAVDAALAAYQALEAKARDLLAVEKAHLDSLKARLDALAAAREAAEAFTRAHAAALDKTEASVMTGDEAALDAALGAYGALDADAQALLTAEKAHLDSLRAKIDQLKGDGPAQTAANAFKTAHAPALAMTTTSVTAADGAALAAALAAYNALDTETQALLTAEKALLDSLQTRLDALAAAEAFTTAHAAALALTTTSVAIADGAAVLAALAAYEALDGDAQALLAAEKALLDSLQTRVDALAAAEAFTTAHAAALTLATASVSAADEAAVLAALAAYNALTGEAKALLAVRKQLLDNLKTRIDALKAAAAFKTAHAAVLAKAAADLTAADKAAVLAALAAHNALDAGTQALLTGEKARLDSHRAGVAGLEAAAFTTDHAPALAQTTASVAAADQAAVDAALAAYNSLDADAKALLAAEKRLLDGLRAQIDQLKGAEPEESIILLNAADLALIGVDGAYPLEGNYVLVADIELRNWMPIGTAGEPFSGSFNGNGYTIAIKSFDESLFNDGENQEPGIGLGIFGWTRGSPETPARISGLTVRAELDHLVSDTDACYVGAVVGYADEYTELGNIAVRGFLNFANKNSASPQRPVFVGGIAGALIASDLKDSDVSADITGFGLAGSGLYNYVGGAVGMFDRNHVDRSLNPAPVIGMPFAGASITNCRVTGNVRGLTEGSSTNVFAGGIAGGAFYGMKTYYGGTIEDCSSTGTVTAAGGGFWSWAGGIAGTISGDGHDDPDAEAAGAAGTGPTRIVRCHAAGMIAAEGPSGSWPYAGGIVGNNYYGGLVSQCWFDGTVKAEGEGISDYTGGIAGYNSKQYYGHGSRIEDCWSAGRVEGRLNAGGIVGQNQAAALVARCYSKALVSVRAEQGAAANQTQTGAGGIAGYNAVTDGKAGGRVQNCVALNPSILSSGGFELLHRVVGNGGGSHSNNLARQDMEILIRGSPVAPGDTGTNAKDGGDCAARPAQTVYQDLGWDFTWVWKMSGGYPVLQWQ